MIDYCKILKEASTIAVVGFSKNPNKTSRQIAGFLQSVGYQVFAVNPTIEEDEIEGIKVFKSLRDIKTKIDIVDVFRKSEDVDALIDDVLAINPSVLWLQSGITSAFARQKAIENGISFIEDTCIYVMYNNCH